ncbi:MAG: S41 family peptidase [Chloroflexi bacterium]|nr:MAG: S41 family peptidase [Chloroflexota bacterium]
MSRYDDPRWYEEQYPERSAQSAYDDLEQDRSPSHVPAYHHTQGPASSLQLQREERARHIRYLIGQIVALIALVAIAFLGGWFSHQYFGATFSTGDQSKTYSQLFQQAWTTIDQRYVDRNAVDYKKMSYAAIQAMVSSLKDTGHTRFLTPEQVQEENQQLSGKFTGIGVYLRQDPKTKELIITSPISGSPAEQAGVKHGDIIMAVNGSSIVGKDINAVRDMLKGDLGSQITLTLKRHGVQEPIIVHITRSQIQVPNVLFHYIAEDHIAHIQVVQFTDGVSGQLKDALMKAKSMGAKKIILDLRENPGGYLSEAINTASMFMEHGNVLLEQDSSGRRTPISVNGNTIDTTSTLVVLVNENSASAAEIVSGSLQDNGRAVIIGQQTFGTGTVLQQFPLSDGSAILLGTQEWLTPKGKFIRGTDTIHGGIPPNISVKLASGTAPLTPNDENADALSEQQILNDGDAQLNAAIKYLEQH